MRALLLAITLAVAPTQVGCVAVSVKTTVTLSLPTEAGEGLRPVPATYRYVVEQSDPVVGLALACLATAVLYGGACWGYLAMPTSDYQLRVINEVLADVSPVLRCASLQAINVERTGFFPTPRQVRLMHADESLVDVARLHEACRRALPAAGDDVGKALKPVLSEEKASPPPQPL